MWLYINIYYLYYRKVLENILLTVVFRTGPNHKFRSNEAQIAVGGRIHDMYSWNPKMKDFDIEVIRIGNYDPQEIPFV